MKTLRYELQRLGAPILVGLLAILGAAYIGISRANLETILFKFLVFCPSLALVHLSRLTLFPWWDLSDAMGPKDSRRVYRDMATIIAAILYYVGMTYVLTATI